MTVARTVRGLAARVEEQIVLDEIAATEAIIQIDGRTCLARRRQTSHIGPYAPLMVDGTRRMAGDTRA